MPRHEHERCGEPKLADVVPGPKGPLCHIMRLFQENKTSRILNLTHLMTSLVASVLGIHPD